MNRIVVGVDGLPAAGVAARWGAREAAMRNLELTVTHVVPTGAIIQSDRVAGDGVTRHVLERNSGTRSEDTSTRCRSHRQDHPSTHTPAYRCSTVSRRPHTHRMPTEVVHIGQMLMGFDAAINYLVDAVFNYPTFSEAYKVAALDVMNKLRILDEYSHSVAGSAVPANPAARCRDLRHRPRLVR